MTNPIGPSFGVYDFVEMLSMESFLRCSGNQVRMNHFVRG